MPDVGHTARGSPSVPVLVRQSTLDVMPAISSIFILVYCTLSLVTVVVHVDCRPSWRRLNISIVWIPARSFCFWERDDTETQQDPLTVRVSGEPEGTLAAPSCCPLSTVPCWYEWINDDYCYFCYNNSNPEMVRSLKNRVYFFLIFIITCLGIVVVSRSSCCCYYN